MFLYRKFDILQALTLSGVGPGVVVQQVQLQVSIRQFGLLVLETWCYLIFENNSRWVPGGIGPLAPSTSRIDKPYIQFASPRQNFLSND